LARFLDWLPVEGCVVSSVPECSGYDGWVNFTLDEHYWPVLWWHPNFWLLATYTCSPCKRRTDTVFVIAAVQEHFEEVSSSDRWCGYAVDSGVVPFTSGREVDVLVVVAWVDCRINSYRDQRIIGRVPVVWG
jgi:hypothetical protein